MVAVIWSTNFPTANNIPQAVNPRAISIVEQDIIVAHTELPARLHKCDASCRSCTCDCLLAERFQDAEMAYRVRRQVEERMQIKA